MPNALLHWARFDAVFHNRHTQVINEKPQVIQEYESGKVRGLTVCERELPPRLLSLAVGTVQRVLARIFLT